MVETVFGYSFCMLRESDAGIKHDTSVVKLLSSANCDDRHNARHDFQSACR